ncbi:hypothetical protein PAE4_20119 [Bacillus altitudinis]|nr:hypothetical protein PAE4_20119 [Bacillus altitudinis]
MYKSTTIPYTTSNDSDSSEVGICATTSKGFDYGRCTESIRARKMGRTE